MIVRGQVWWADLPPPIGSEPGYTRPVLVVQADELNRMGLRTTIGIILTTNLSLAEIPGNVLVRKKDSGLPKDSVANVTQILAMDNSQFRDLVGTLHADIMNEVDNGLRYVLDLENALQ